ncbi:MULTISPECIES: DUF982 domain-containing protein [unclassified Mesorhizobium]|uniref:DUF982 domain-containing protein n=1 Tax=unclassified Mesorhizobium TaxID=325217 RepID=UPI00333A47CE
MVEVVSLAVVRWTKRGPKWNKAERVCMAALAGELSPDDARIGFKAAAIEKKMLVAGDP